MAAKYISTTQPAVVCDICGRNLLRGERPDRFLASGEPRLVCELCVTRATNEGWVREGAVRDPRERSRRARGRSLLARLARRRGERGSGAEAAGRDEQLAAERNGGFEPLPPHEREAEPMLAEPQPSHEPQPAPPLAYDLKLEHALETFNASKFPRTVAGVARSLGTPLVSVRAQAPESTIVAITVAWELYWYRYDVDTAVDAPEVAATAQGTELHELDERDRIPNAAADDRGELRLIQP
jgi:hypothetical protein